MEPLMSFEGYQVIESTSKSKDLLNDFYGKLGYKITESTNTDKENNPSISKQTPNSEPEKKVNK